MTTTTKQAPRRKTMTLNLNVTQARIDEANRRMNLGEKRAENCPIALSILSALPRRFKQLNHVEVIAGLTVLIVYSDTTGNYELKTPARIKRFMDRFDDGDKVKPFKSTIVLKAVEA